MKFIVIWFAASLSVGFILVGLAYLVDLIRYLKKLKETK